MKNNSNKIFDMKNNSIIIEKNIQGNFIFGIGNDTHDYAKCWEIDKNENYDWCFSNDGNSAYCICKKNTEEETNIKLRCKFNYDSEISFNLLLSETKDDLNIEYNIYYILDNVKKYLKVDENVSEKIPSNSELNIILKIKNGKRGNIITSIEKMNCLTTKKTQEKMSFNDFVDILTKSIKNN